ncbi:MAG: glutamate synthase subunit alpha, partial [Thermoleophilia bacterium]|nr:glutamate synthase subunit alpha [Thermoleophilia bacterium]
MTQPFPSSSALAGTLYRGDLEHESCGIGFVARIDGTPSHDILEVALTALCRQLHRGGLAADGDTGDGAGVLLQVPRAFLARELGDAVDEAPLATAAVGMCFLPYEATARLTARALVDQHLVKEDLAVLAWRTVPVDAEVLSAHARASMPSVEQVIVARPAELDADAFERRLLLARRGLEQAALDLDIDVHIASLSARTIVYKGMLASTQVGAFYPELHDELMQTAVAMYHQRFSTNTFPSWERAQPLRMLCHNGEINTIRGNVNSIRGRHADLDTDVWAGRAADLVPIIDERGSDSAMLDNVVEMLVRSGMDARRALMMSVPTAWERAVHMQPDVREFYEYQSLIMESWDGPAALSFCDGRRLGTVLDRNGLRPARYVVTTDGLVISGSEVGLVDLPPERVAYKGRLGPGEMIAVDLQNGLVELPTETTGEIITASPWAEWTRQAVVDLALEDITPDAANERPDGDLLLRRLDAAGYSREDVSVVLKPMAMDAYEAIGSMGDDTPHAVLSAFPRSVYGCFRQRFAEVTNPPIDPIRERGVMSLTTLLGPRPKLLAGGAPTTRMLRVPSPVLGAVDGLLSVAAKA